MLVIINTENGVVNLQDKTGIATINKGVLTLRDKNITLTDVQSKVFTDVISTVNDLSKGLLGVKTVKSLVYTNGAFSIIDSTGELHLSFENAITLTKEVAAVKAFKALCESWVPKFVKVTYTAPNSLVVDTVEKNVDLLEGSEKATFGAISAVLVAAINK